MPSTHKATVEKNDDGTWDIACYRVTAKGDRVGAPEWTSTGWPTKARAESRLREHGAEHESGESAPELVDSAARAD